jgi:hypothetical protein
MTDQEPAEYRGELIYSQEDGYKLITMTVGLYHGEESHVMSHVYNFPIQEEAEHLPADSPLAGVDLYRFPAFDGTNIMLSVEGQEEKYTAVYSVRETGIDEHTVSLLLDIMEVHEAQRELAQEPQTAQERQSTLDEVLQYYKDEIPGWLEAQDRLDTTIYEPFHDHNIGFDR